MLAKNNDSCMCRSVGLNLQFPLRVCSGVSCDVSCGGALKTCSAVWAVVLCMKHGAVSQRMAASMWWASYAIPHCCQMGVCLCRWEGKQLTQTGSWPAAHCRLQGPHCMCKDTDGRMCEKQYIEGMLQMVSYILHKCGNVSAVCQQTIFLVCRRQLKQ